MPSITLVQYAGLSDDTTISPPCGKVHMALRFKGLEYGIKNVQSPAEARRYNPRGRVPALIIDGQTHVDSTDILDVLDEAYPDPPLQPGEASERVMVKILEDWADEVVYFYGLYLRFVVPDGFERFKRLVLSRMPAPMRWVAPPIVHRDLSRRAMAQGVGLKGKETAQREAFQCYGAISELLEGKTFLVGGAITRADLAVAAVLDQHLLEEITPDLAAEIRRLPNIMAWLDRVHQSAPGGATPGAQAS